MYIIGRKLCEFYSSYIHIEGVQNTQKSESNLHARLCAVGNRTQLKNLGSIFFVFTFSRIGVPGTTFSDIFEV